MDDSSGYSRNELYVKITDKGMVLSKTTQTKIHRKTCTCTVATNKHLPFRSIKFCTRAIWSEHSKYCFKHLHCVCTLTCKAIALVESFYGFNFENGGKDYANSANGNSSRLSKLPCEEHKFWKGKVSHHIYIELNNVLAH